MVKSQAERVNLDALLRQRLERQRSAALWRRRVVLEAPQRAETVIDGRPMLNFCSNDYLGLAADPRLVAAGQRALAEWGSGAGASALVCGQLRPHQQLEEALAAWTGRPRALLFSSGYLANLGVLTTLLGRGDQLLQDRLNHASLLDGGRLSGARMQRFRHGEVADLERRLQRASAGACLVAVDGVFSMDGDRAPLVELAAAARRHRAWLMVDDAHGLGVLGPEGAGSVADSGLSVEEVPVLMGTLGKALGGAGAFVAGSETLIDALTQFARTAIYTTAMPPATAATALVALALAREEGWRRQQLAEHIDFFRAGAAQLGLPLLPSDTAIQPLMLGSSEAVLAASAALARRGLWVAAIRPPTVPEGTARLRIVLTAGHDRAQVQQLLDALAEVVPA